MKATKTALVLAAFGLTIATTSASASPTKAVALDDSKPTQLCTTAANGTTVGMLVSVKRSGWSMTFVRNNIVCNGESIGQFAAKYGSDGVKGLLPAHVGVKIIDLAKNNAYSGYVSVSK